MECNLILTDEVNCRLEGLPLKVKNELVKAVTLIDPKAKYTPQGKLGRWDGKIHFMNMGGYTYTNLLPILLPILDKHGIEINLIDERINPSFEFEPIDNQYFADVVFPEGHHMEGKSIILHDHQVNAVNACLTSPHGIIQACTSSGKAQPLSEPVLTPMGWKSMGSLQVNDLVITPNGKTASVLKVFPQGVKQTYKVMLGDGRETRCCKEHLWSIYINGSERTLVDTEELIKLLNKGYNITIPTVYGDNVHSHYDDGEQFQIIKDIEIDLSETRLNRIKYILELVDTNHVFKTHDEYEFKIFKELVYSVGIFSELNEFNSKDGYSMYVDYEKHYRRSIDIVNVIKDSPEECQCILIDSEEHLYITRDFIVTHNTLITAALSKAVERYGRSIVIVPSVDLVTQTANDYKLVGLDVGMLADGIKELDNTHIITTWQSLNSLWKKTKADEIPLSEQDVHDMLDGVICVIVDECHTAKADALQAILGQVMHNVPLRWGLTGTIPKDDISEMKINCMIGQVIFKITAKELQEKGILSTCNINAIKLYHPNKFKDYAEEIKWLVYDEERLAYIANLIDIISESGNTLILVDKIKTGKMLCELLNIDESDFVYGNTKKKDRETSYKEIRWVDNKKLIATYGVASTGISISRIYNVILIEPGKSFVRCIQSIGRGLRKAQDKDHVEIYDLYGSSKYSNDHFNERKRYYNEVEYPCSKLEVKDWYK